MKTKKYTRKAAGIDTGKHKLDIAIHGSHDPLEVANDTAGHEQLIEWLVERKIKRIGIEASGGYEKAVVAALRPAGFQVIVFQAQAGPLLCRLQTAAGQERSHRRSPDRQVRGLL